jgi:hypothetical protein
MAWRSVFKPEGSVMAGVAVMGAVYGVYQLSVGTASQAQATEANHPVLEMSRKKAGWEALVLVAGVGLIARDANIIILGSATIVAMELNYRHAIMAHPDTGVMQPPGNQVYMPAQNVTPMYQTATGTDDSGYGY